MRGARQSDAGRRARNQDNPLIFSFHIALHRIIERDFSTDLPIGLSEVGLFLVKSPV
jgi:hypothetical protein